MNKITRKSFLEIFAKISAGTFASSYIEGQSPLILLPAGSGPNRIVTMDELSFIDSILNYRLVLDVDPKNLMIMCHSMSLTADLIPGNRHIAIFAYELTINGEIDFMGKNVFILANKIINKNYAALNVSGPNGQKFKGQSSPNQPCNNGVIQPPIDADNVDELGSNEDLHIHTTVDSGDSGWINGKDSGKFYLNCLSMTGDLKIIAMGGNGDKGENGMHGLNGCPAIRDGSWGVFAASGTSGSKGAPGGYGGNGGTVKISIPNNISDLPTQLMIKTDKGEQGESGDSGEPGLGGKGIVGIGVSRPMYDDSDAHHPRTIPGEPTQYPDGKTGAQVPALINTHERDGQIGQVQGLGTNDIEYFKYIPIDFAKLLMLKAESLYLNSNFTKDDTNLLAAYEIFDYISILSDKYSGYGLANPATSEEVASLLSYLTQYDATNQSKWAFLKQKAAGYKGQINLGLDIFGNPHNYAPNLSADYITSIINQAIPLVNGFSNYIEKLVKDQRKLENQHIKNDLNEAQCKRTIRQLNDDIANYRQMITVLQKEINVRFIVIEEMKANLVGDDNEFRKDIEDSTGGCKLETVIHFLTAVVAIVSAIYTCGATAYAAYKSIGPVIDDLQSADTLNEIKDALKGVQDISKEMDDVNSNLKKFQDAYKQLAIPITKTPDSLIAVDKEKFDKTIDQFLNLPSAQIYKTDFHEFLDYVDLTNQKRKELTSILLSLNNAYQTVKLLTDQLDNLKATSIRTTNQQVSATDKISLYDLYYKTKWYVIQAIYLQNKAIAYQYAKEAASHYDDISFEALQADSFKSNIQLLTNLDRSTFSYVDENELRPLSVNFGDFPRSFANFLKVRELNSEKYFSFEFTIKAPLISGIINDHENAKLMQLESTFPTNLRNIKVMGVLLAIKSSAAKKQKLLIRLSHHGNSTVTTTAQFQGQKLYMHSPKQVNITTEVEMSPKAPTFEPGKKINLVGGTLGVTQNTALGVSPFATWTLDIFMSDNQGLTQNKVIDMIKAFKSVDLYFWYYFQYVNGA